MSHPSSRRRLSATLVALCTLQACGSAPQLAFEAPSTTASVGPDERLVGRDDDFIVVRPKTGDTFSGLAAAYLGNPDRAWWIREANGVAEPAADQALVIPLKPRNPGGVARDGYQTVVVLCYHRFASTRGKLAVTPAAFAEQLDYLKEHDFQVVRLSQLERFLRDGYPLPKRSVVITIDDGYRSTYEVAWPLLRKRGYPATVFLYTDFAGTGGALTWPQMGEMTQSGLIEVQPHSKTHGNLALRAAGESDARYRERMRKEVEIPSALLEARLGQKVHAYAYPYGDTNPVVIDQLTRRRIETGFTVTSGGNPFFGSPYMLRRTMIFGEDDLAAFASKLTVFSKVPGR